jgi:hypothetical protein
VTPPVAGTIPDGIPAPVRAVDDLPDALDLPDVPAPTGDGTGSTRAHRPLTSVRSTPATPAPATTTSTNTAPARGASANGVPIDDLTDWI